MSNDWNDPRRIALIAVRTGSGAPRPNSNQAAQAIVVGEVPVDPNGVIVDPSDKRTSFTYEWRYACFSLPQLQKLQNEYKSAAAVKNASWQDIVHPLDGRRASTLRPDGLKPYNPEYYFKPDVIPTTQLIGTDEKNDLLGADDLLSSLIAQLKASITPYIDDAGTQSTTAVPLLNFALPLRDVVRLAIYDKDNQPFTAPDKSAPSGPLTVLDTCRFVVTPNGTTDPLDPTDLSHNKVPPFNQLGSRIILFTDPTQIVKNGPDKNKRVSAQGKLVGFAVLAEARLALNGDTSLIIGSGQERALFRFFAVRNAQRLNNSLYPHDSQPQLIGPLFDSMRVGYTTGPQTRQYTTLAIRQQPFSALAQKKARATDTAATPRPNVVPILDQMGITFATDAVNRELGFRFVDIDGQRLILRFEAFYFLDFRNKMPLPETFVFFTNPFQYFQQVRFAQEQRFDAVNWQLSPSSAASWVFTARDTDSTNQTKITQEVINTYNARVDALHRAQRLTDDATPISLLPHLSTTGRTLPGLKSPAWHFVGYLIDRRPYSQTINVDASIAPGSRREIDADFLTLEPMFIDDMFAGDVRTKEAPKGPAGLLGEFGVLATARFDRFVLTSNSLPSYDVILSAPVFTDPSEANPPAWVDPPAFQPAMSGLDAANAYRGAFFGIKVLSTASAIELPSSNGTTRIGALELGLLDKFPNGFENTDGVIRLLALPPISSDPDLARAGIDALIKLPLGSVLPGGQDDLPSDAQITAEDRILDVLRDSALDMPDSDAPLLLPLEPPAALPPRLTLFANETVTRHQNHTVELSIKATQTAQSAADGRLLVIDPAPFRVALVKTIDLSAAQTNESNEIAVWNAAGENGLSWRVVDDAGAVSLVLPPQVIGEAMEKDNNTAKDGYPPDIAENKPAAARIGSATRLDLDPSYFDTRYVEPGWNLRRIMGYPGQRAPGARLRDLRLELMYGIMTRLTPSNPGVQVAEIGAVIGALANSLPADADQSAVQNYISAFNAFRIAQNRRLAVDRLWQGNPLDDLTIEQDASFALRTKTAQTVTFTVGGTAHNGDTLNIFVTLNNGQAGPSINAPVKVSALPPNAKPADIAANNKLALDTATSALIAAIKAAMANSPALAEAITSPEQLLTDTFSTQLSTTVRSISVNVAGAGATTTLLLNGVSTIVQSGPLTPFRWPVPGGVPSDLDPSLKDSFSDDVNDAQSFAGGVPWAFESNNILRSVYSKVAGDGGRARNVHLSALGGWGNQRGLFDQKKTAVETETTMGRVHRYALERIGRIGALWHRAKHIIVYERSVVPSAQFYNTGAIGKQQDQLLGRPVLRKVEEYVELLEQVRRYPEQGNAVEAAGCLTGAEFVDRRIRVDSRWGGDVRNEGWQVPLWNKAFDLPPKDPKNPDDPAFVYPKPHIRFLVMGEGGVEKALEIAEPEKLVFYTSVIPSETGDNTDAWHPVRDIDFIDLPAPQVGASSPGSDDLIDALMPGEQDYPPGHEKLTIGLLPSKDTVAITHGRQDKGPVALLHNVTLGRSVAADPGSLSGNAANAAKLGSGLTQAVSNVRVTLDRAVGAVNSDLSKAGVALDKAAKAADVAKATAHATIDRLFDANTGSVAKAINQGTQVLNGIQAIGTGQPCAALETKLRAQIKMQTDGAQNTVDDYISTISEQLTSPIQSIVAMLEDAKSKQDDELKAIFASVKSQLAAAVQGPQGLLVDIRKSVATFIDQANFDDSAIRAAAGAELKTLTDFANKIKDAAKNDVATKLQAAEPQIPNVAAVTDQTLAAARTAAQNLQNQVISQIQTTFDNATALLGALTPSAVRLKIAVNDVLLNATALCLGIVDAQTAANCHDLTPAHDDLLKAINNLPASIDDIANSLLGTAFSSATTWAQQASVRLKGITDGTLPAAEALEADIRTKYLPPLRTAIDEAGSLSTTTLRVAMAVDSTLARIADLAQAVAANKVEPYTKQISDIESAAADLVKQIASRIDLVATKADGMIASLQAPFNALKKKAADGINTLCGNIAQDAKDLNDKADLIINSANVPALRPLIDQALGLTTDLQGKVTSGVTNLATTIHDQEKQFLVSTAAPIDSILSSLKDSCTAIEGFVQNIIGDGQAAIGQIIGNLGIDPEALKKDIDDEIDSLVAQGKDQFSDFQNAVLDKVNDLSQQLNNRVQRFTSSVQDTIQNSLGADPATVAGNAQRVFQQGDDTLRLFRALGDPPKTDQLGFNRPQVAYVFQEANKIVNMTPTISLVNRVADSAAALDAAAQSAGNLLTTFGIRLPASGIGDQLMPDALKNLDISKLFPDFSGIKLDGLFKNFGFPSLSDSDAVKVRHGFDPTELSAWLEADIDVPFDSSAPLMDFGPVQIMVDQARFTASARIAEGRAGTQKSMNGKLFGDWRVVCVGQTIMTFEQTSLTFDQTGHLNFNIQPDRVALADALQFLTDLVEDTGEDGDFQVVPYMYGGVPSGIAAQLDLVLPPIQTGVFGISDLSLHILFGVSALPEFEIITELGVGSKMAPFTLNVWILNGGGFVTLRLSYMPMHKPASLLVFTLEVGIVVGVGLGFSFGVVSGGVYVQVGCAIAITWTTGAGGSTTAVTVFLLIRGNVDVAGIITVGLSLMLGITYDGSKMVASGTLNLTIKISVFFTLSVSEHVEYDFAGGQSKSSSSYSESYA